MTIYVSVDRLRLVSFILFMTPFFLTKNNYYNNNNNNNDNNDNKKKNPARTTIRITMLHFDFNLKSVEIEGTQSHIYEELYRALIFSQSLIKAEVL